MGKTGAVCDVLVLGAGPAGCATAIHCAAQGLRVTLLEAKAFPRHRPGETLHPGVEPILRQLGALAAVEAADFLRHTGNWIAWGAAPRFEPFGRDERGAWQGFQAWRGTFDALLLARARELGVTIQQPCAAFEAVRADGRVTGVVTSAGPIAATFVVDASGGTHWLARELGLAIEKHLPRLVARYGYVEGECPARDEAPAIVADDDGWTWTARVRPQLYQWTRVAWRREARAKVRVPEELRGLAPQGPARAADVTWRRVSKPAGPGYFLAGDAAAVLDPAASHGVLKALMSGMMVAHLIAQVHARRGNESSAIAAYDEWVTGWFSADVAKLREFYAALPGARDWLQFTASPDPARGR